MDSFDLVGHLKRQMAWSHATFGPGERTAGVIDHIRKELVEVEQGDGDASEWVDVVILALDALPGGLHSLAVTGALIPRSYPKRRAG